MAVITEIPAKTCRKCGKTKPLDQFPEQKLSKSRDGRLALCKICERRRRQLYDHGNDLGFAAVREAPDRRPAVRLRGALERLRGAGLPFDRAWAAACRYALPGGDDEEWRTAFAWSRPYWEAAYLREPWAGCENPLFLASDD